ncbi:MAG: DUF4303 domain-containing protein [Thermomicrobiales bacterium]|nr:DUF4303 domain-containing protein [Thermomicrobiales bacterium]
MANGEYSDQEMEKRLRLMIADAVRHAFRAVREHVPDERFYMFALYSTEMYRWFEPVPMGVQGLEKVTTEYQVLPSFREETRESIEASLRWSVADSPYYGFGNELFKPIDDVIAEFNPDPGDDDAKWDRYMERVCVIQRAMIGALNDVDAEGLFGLGAERDAIVIGHDIGDQTDRSRWEFALKLNPRSALSAFRSGLHIKAPRGDMRILSPEKVSNINGIGVSPRTKSIVIAGPSAIAGWRFSGDLFFTAEVDVGDEAWSLVLSADGKLLLVRQRESIRRFDLDRVIELERIPYPSGYGDNLLAIALSHDQRRLALADWASRLTMTAYGTGEVIWRNEHFSYDLAFSPDDALVLSVGNGARVLNSASGDVIRELLSPSDDPTHDCACAWSSDGAWLATTRHERKGPVTLTMWDESLKQRATWTLPGKDLHDSVRAIAFSPNCDMVATAHMSGDLRVWSCPDGETILDVCGRWESLRDVVWIDQHQVAAVGYDPDRSPPFGIWNVPKARRHSRRVRFPPITRRPHRRSQTDGTGRKNPVS